MTPAVRMPSAERVAMTTLRRGREIVFMSLPLLVVWICSACYRMNFPNSSEACIRLSSNLISIAMKKDSTPKPVKVRRPRGRPRSFDRDAALDAAMQVFWAKGFEAASLSDLTMAMGINPPSLYATVGDKEKLFLEAMARYRGNQGEACPYAAEPTARGAIEKLLTNLACEFTDSCHPRGCMMVMAATTSTGTSAAFQQVLARQRDEGKAHL